MSDDIANGHKTSLIDYPCAFPIKVLGKQDPELTETLVKVVLEYDPAFDAESVQTRLSKHGNYVGLTFTVTATSREQLDELYRALHAHPLVSLVL
jgi:putative lipoic acid-binding regulatory protein